MSIKLEVLDYNLSAAAGTQMITNEEFAFTGAGWNVGYTSCPPSGGWFITANQAHFCATLPFNQRILRNTKASGKYFEVGRRYRLEYKVGYNTTPTSGNTNFLRLYQHSNTPTASGGFDDIVLNTAAGTHTVEWTQGGSYASQVALRILCGNGFNGYLSFVKAFPLTEVSWDKSVVGELDVGDHIDFPLSLTFQISDIKNITSTSGTFSKTFKIPATKHNNKMLKNFYDSKSDFDANLTTLKKCRILVNNLYSLDGLLKVTGSGGYGKKASFYDCVFFGNNMSWASLIEEKSLAEIDWGTDIDSGTPLNCNVFEIEGSKGWEQTNCESNASHITWPITSYGDFNPDGDEGTVQFLFTKSERLANTGNTSATGFNGYYGYDEFQNPYGTPLPTSDWRPAIWVKNTIDKIFNNVGYTINSNFMNTDMFKKLVWLLPNAKYNNPSERTDRYSFKARLGSASIPLQASDIAQSTVQTVRYPVTGTFPSQSATGNFSKLHWFEVEDSSTVTIDNYGCGEIGNCDPLHSTASDWGNTVFGYRNSNGYFYAPEYGYYTIKFKGMKLKIDNLQYSGGGCVFHLHDTKVQVGVLVKTIGETTFSFQSPPAYQEHEFDPHDLDRSACTSVFEKHTKELTIDFSETIWLNRGDRVLPYIRFYHNRQHPAASGTFYSYDVELDGNGGSIQYLLNADYLEWGQKFDLSKLINSEYRQIDFIKGIAHAFNLKITTNETSRQVTIEPFDDFYKTYSSAIDWTYKLDRSKTSEYKELKTGLKRQLQFNYKEDNKDGKVEAMGEQYFNGIPDVFPYQESLDTSFEKGLSVYENPFFSGTVCGSDRDMEGVSSDGGRVINSAKNAILWECNNDVNLMGRCNKGRDYKPRLLFWNKYSPNATYGQNHTKGFMVHMWAYHNKQVSANSSGSIPNPIFPIYPQATSYNRLDPDSPNLCYGNITAQTFDDNGVNPIGNPVTVKGLFETYYKYMIEQFKVKPRIQTSYFDIKISDIVVLDFTKLIYVDGCYWRLNKIIDYQPHKNQSTKVELIEWIDVGTFGATPPPTVEDPFNFGDNPNPLSTQ